MNADNADDTVRREGYPVMQELWFAWFNWIKTLMINNQMPLSGNVHQWIEAWGQAVGQIGLLNVNTANSRNPATERVISTKYSYGRQLGRILDVLAPLVEEKGDWLCEQRMLKQEDLKEFQDMVNDITSAKRRSSIAGLLDTIADVRKSFPYKYQRRFDHLVEVLNELKSHWPPDLR